MAKLLLRNQQLIYGTLYPRGVYSRVFGLSCKVLAGIGNDDLAYSPPLGATFWLVFVGIHYCGGLAADPCAGTIYISFGTGVPTGNIVATVWEILIPFWAGTTKPAIMVQGTDQYLWFPINRPFTREALRFGMVIENGSATRPFWVDTFFGISEG